MHIDLETLEVSQIADETRFEAWVNGLPSRLDYIENKDSFVITHVGVHPSLRGHGVAGKLVQTALEYARAKSLRVVPMCSYAVAYIRRNPQYAELTRAS